MSNVATLSFPDGQAVEIDRDTPEYRSASAAWAGLIAGILNDPELMAAAKRNVALRAELGLPEPETWVEYQAQLRLFSASTVGAL